MPATTPVDAAPRAVMWSIGQIAARDGVSKQAISKHVKRLVASGLAVDRNARGNVTAVNVAQFDHLSGKFRDPTKDQRPAQTAAAVGDDDDESLKEATRQRAWLQAEREKITLAERKRELVRAAGVAQALIAAGADIARIVDRLVNAADDIAAAYERDGAHGLRVVLKQRALRMRTDIADALAKAATDQPDTETGEPDLLERAEAVS